MSFWGDVERAEGLLLWLHLLAFLVILGGTLRDRQKVWHVFLDISLGVSWFLMLFALGQFLNVSSLLATSGARVDATLGNAAFFAAYLLFHIAFAAYLFFKKADPGWKIYYAATAVFAAFLIFATQTRGAVIGLAAGIITAAVLLLFSNRGDSRVKNWSLGVIAFIIVAGGAIFLLRDQPAIKNNDILRRVSSISLSERTAETRLITWRAAWDGWKEKFVFGWGLENFDQVFNKNFSPRIYEDEGSQVWFDRAHNLIFDRGVVTGIVGLALFLALLLYPAYYFLRYHLNDPEKRVSAIIFSSFIVAYIIQDMFIFESITAYIVLIFTWAFLGSFIKPITENLISKHAVWAVLLAIYILAVIPVMQGSVLKPARLNLAAAAALRSDPEKEDFFAIVGKYQQVLAEPSYARREIRIQFIEFVDQQLANVGEVIPEVKPVLAYTDEQAMAQITENPDDAKAFLLTMRHFIYTHKSLPAESAARLEKALSFYPKLAELSPSRPHVYQEFGYAHLYLFQIYLGQNNSPKAAESFARSEEGFRKAVELNPAVVESYVNLAMLYLNSDDNQKIKNLIVEMDEKKVNFRNRLHLSKLINLAKSNERLEWINYFSEELVKLNPNDVTGWIDLAVYYATIGDRDKAIEIAERIRQFGGEYVEQSRIFVENVKKGAYEKK